MEVMLCLSSISIRCRHIPGVDGKNVLSAVDVYGKEDSLVKDVVIRGREVTTHRNLGKGVCQIKS
jgi:hypothetical protein